MFKKKVIAAVLSAVLMLTGMFTVVPPVSTQAAGSAFVGVSGSKFVLNGSDFYFSGSNNYYFHYASQTMVDDVLNKAVAMNLKVMRIWGFTDGTANAGVNMQPQAGVYDESGFKKLDYAIYKAGQLGIKLVIPMVNNWDDFGGMNQYVKWFNAGTHDAFYTNSSIKTAYKNYVNYLINRTNTYNNVKYKDDPTIMTWELANEPRCQSDTTGNTLVNWANEMSTYVKSLDSNHLVAVGDEGFYNISGNSDWMYGGGEGVDWTRLTSLTNIDYGTYHLYPDGWNRTVDWGTQWIKNHIADGKTIGKPTVLEEYGIKDYSSDQSLRNATYQTWLDTVYTNGGAGDQFWILTGIQDDGSLYPDYDGFRITYPSTTTTVISNHAQQMNALNVTTVPAVPAGLTATAGNTQVVLNWTAATGAASYNVKRATVSGGPYTTVATGVTTTSYTNTGLTNGTTYYYVVSAVNGIGESANSTQVSATPSVTIPAAPSGLTVTAGNAQATLSWTASSGATSYNVKRATVSGGPYTTVATGVTTNAYTNTGLTNGTMYYYVVSAVNSAGESANSTQVSATPVAVNPGSLVVQYKLSNSNATDNQIYATFNIKNTGTTAVSLNNLKLRYYFTKDTSSNLNFWCDYAQVGSGNVSNSFVTVSPAKTGADTYAELSFASGAGSIAAGGQSGEIQIRIAKADWSNFIETNDYSFDGTKTTFADWNKVTLYQSGVLAWGLEP
ncbi:cellulose binding domain-containing protein [Gorillibacterium massiliense]|uniref:cellulose binding domain-containing protein n=1 Tax=Gorillibacterium massiliense TaxID=1280390 RepID=UPI0004B4D698|nr:cellulose binding domain-containing protein [Gorillibacterium massiliense]